MTININIKIIKNDQKYKNNIKIITIDFCNMQSL